MRAQPVLERLAGMSAAAQASVPAIYAWGVTVVPVAWGRGGSVLAKAAAVAALLAVAAGVAGERRWGSRARFAALWGFVLSSAVAWSGAPGALGAMRIDAPRALAGMLGWALFAFTSAAPALEGRRTGDEPLDAGAPLPPRKVLAPGDIFYVAGGTIIAVCLQAVGWRVASAERALLVRVVTLAAGLAILGVATDVALARHAPRFSRPRSVRLRRALAPLVMLAVLSLTGLVFVFRD